MDTTDAALDLIPREEDWRFMVAMRVVRGGFVKLKPASPAVIGALAGSAIGARLALLTPA